jgi:hypothetical protein
MSETHATAQATLRRRLLAVLAIGFVGTGAELLLLDHYEDVWQKVPLALIVLSLMAMAGHAFYGGAAFVRAFQATMWLVIAGGMTGLVLHFRGNMEFELEMRPENSGWPLIWTTLKGATPSLAPGLMILLGLLGLVATARTASRTSGVQLSQTQTVNT